MLQTDTRLTRFIPTQRVLLSEFDAWDAASPGYSSVPLAQGLALSLVRLPHRAPEAIFALQMALVKDPTWIDGWNTLICTRDAQPDRAWDARLARMRWWSQFGAEIYQHRERGHTNRCDPDRPLRIGYVSADFWMHSGTCCFGAIILGHSDEMETVCYSSTPLEVADGMTRAFQARTEWHDVADWSDDQLVQHIRNSEVDILVDLTAHTPGNRLTVFAAKPAPLQLTGFGYATGVHWPAGVMDGLFADPIVAPDHSLFTEQIINLPCVIGYSWPAYAPPVSPLPCLTAPPVFGAFHQPRKLNAAVLALWAQILERVPGSRVQFKGRGYTPDVQAWITRQLPADTAEFLPVTPHIDHLAAYGGIDLQLDTFPQTGGVTTCEAALMGVPCVTLTDPTIIHRTSASILTVLGVPEAITSTPRDYVDRAVALVTTERHTLVTLRRILRGTLQQSPICLGYTAAVEAAYRNLWRAWCASKE